MTVLPSDLEGEKDGGVGGGGGGDWGCGFGGWG